MPTVELPPVVPLTAQVTLVFEVFETVAANCCVLPTVRGAVEGETETVIGAGGVGALPLAPQDMPRVKMSATRIEITSRSVIGALERRAFVSLDTVGYIAGEFVGTDPHQDKTGRWREEQTASE